MAKKMTQEEVVEALKKLAPHIEELLFLPCCHTTGMHDPQHFEEKKYVCADQKAKTLERFCRLLGINPVTQCGKNCGWCQDYKDKRKGAGLALFWPNEDLVQRFEKEASGWQKEPTEEVAQQIVFVLSRKPQYKNLIKDFKREWSRFLGSKRRMYNNRLGREEAFGRTSENSPITGKPRHTWQPYDLERAVVYALRHSKRIFGL